MTRPAVTPILAALCLSCFGPTNDAAFQSFARSVERTARRGDLAELDRLAATDPVAKSDPELAALVLGNAYFALGEPETALAFHERAAGAWSLRDPARLEGVIDLLALGRFADACARAGDVPSSYWSSGELEIVSVDLDLRCGRAAEGSKKLRRIFEESHSRAEEGLARVFGELNGFARRKTSLEATVGGSSERALAELHLCSDFQNPYEPHWTFDGAVTRLESLADAEPGSCALAGRLATARLLRAWKSPRGSAAAATDLARFLAPEPQCAEAAEAELLRLRLGKADASHAQAIRLLEAAAGTFPSEPALAFALAGERDAAREPDAAALASLLTRYPDEWYPYARLAVEGPDTPEGRDESRALLRRGLTRFPNSILLNELLALLLQRDQRWDESVEPSALALAGLLETQSNHHGWATGMSLLANALERKSLHAPLDREQRIAFVRGWADVATLDQGFIGDYGCFRDPQRAAFRALWYRPELVTEAVKTAEAAARHERPATLATGRPTASQ